MFGFNWVDLVLLVAFFAILSDGRKSDLITEILKLIGVVLATFITLHYYAKLSVLLQGKVFVPQDYRDLFAYALIIGLMLAMITMIRNGWLILLGIDAHPFVEKWGARIAAALRAYLMMGLVFLAFFVSNDNFLMDQARNCRLARYTQDISLGIYKNVFQYLSLIFPDEVISVDAVVLTAEDRKRARMAITAR